jgi:pimeloyl-ACP methyl ester carboxylesterase
MKFTRRWLLNTARYVPLAYLLSKPAPPFLLYFVCGNRPFSDKLVPLFRQIEKLVKPEVMAHRMRMLNEIDATTDARALNLPCCYIQGARDRLVPARCTAPFKKYLPDIMVKTVNGPHGILQAQPEACAQIITEFVKGLLVTPNAKLELGNK